MATAFFLGDDIYRSVPKRRKEEPMLSLVQAFMVRIPGKPNPDYYIVEEDAKLAARGQGEWGGDELVHPVTLLLDGRGTYVTVGNAVTVHTVNDPEARKRALAKLSYFDRKALGLKE
jgi:hypothetical protein